MGNFTSRPIFSGGKTRTINWIRGYGGLRALREGLRRDKSLLLAKINSWSHTMDFRDEFSFKSKRVVKAKYRSIASSIKYYSLILDNFRANV
jgi:hypothetical protein